MFVNLCGKQIRTMAMLNLLTKVIALICILLNVSGAAPKVKTELYFEALCPSCQAFTTGVLFSH